MYKMRTLLIIVLCGLLTNCAGNTYKIKSENKKNLVEVPKWYMNDFKEKKACDLKVFNSKDNEKLCIFGVGTSVSPDLNLAIEKATMIAKAEMADNIMGEMNKKSRQYITEVGTKGTKTATTEVDSTIVNTIKDTPVRGYETFAKEVLMTKQGYYRAWVGLRLPLGEFNKLYNYSINESLDANVLKENAQKAFDNVEGKDLSGEKSPLTKISLQNLTE